MSVHKAFRRRLSIETCESRHMLSLSPLGLPDLESPVGISSPVMHPEFFRNGDNLSQIVLAMLNHESATQRLPAHAIYDQATDEPLLSWRVSLLPYLGHSELYDRFALDEPWDSPNNHPLIKEMPSVYISESLPTGPLVPGGTPSGIETVFQVMLGAGTVFPESDEGVRIRDIRDGLSNTVFVVESNPEKAVPWTKPDDIPFDEMMPLDSLGSITDFGFRAVLGTGEVADVPQDVDPELWTRMALRDDGQFTDLLQIMPPLEPEVALRQITLAMLNHESATQKLPAAATTTFDGQPLLSWRVAVLPYLEQSALADQFERGEAWDSEYHLALAEMMPRVFAHAEVQTQAETIFQVLVGEGTAFTGERRGIGIGEILDGTASTVLVAEVNADRAQLWTQPGDIPFDEANPLDGVGDINDNGFWAAMADGSVLNLPGDIDPQIWTWMVLRDDGNFVDLSQFLPPLSASQALWRLSLAALNYESVNGHLPAPAIVDSAGQPLLSWRVLLLPYLEHGNLFDMFRLDEPWDSEHNLPLSEMMPMEFRQAGMPSGMTNLLAFVGEDTVFPPTDNGQGLKLSKIKDGLSQTILFAEADAASAMEWTRPGDISFDPADPLNGVAGDGDFHVVFADGDVDIVPADIDPNVFSEMVVRNDSQPSNLFHQWGDPIVINPDFACFDPALVAGQAGLAASPYQVTRSEDGSYLDRTEEMIESIFASEFDWIEPIE